MMAKQDLPFLHVTPTRPQILDLDNLPIPDRSLVDYDKYHQYIGISSFRNSMSMQATRGCPYRCLYCQKIGLGKHVNRSAENILKELLFYYNLGVRRFAFIDDLFNLNRENSRTFFELVIKNHLDIQLSFPNGLKGDILDKELIDLMVKAGTREIGLGLETASPRIQKLIEKELDLEKFRQNCEYLCETYPFVITRLYTMFGFPSETEEEADMTLNFIKALKWVHWPYLFALKIFPGTGMEKLAVRNGISPGSIASSMNLAFHQLPETLPFKKSFALKYKSQFFNHYFLSRQRLLSVLPIQITVYTEKEILLMYNAYLPTAIHSLRELLEFLGIDKSELGIDACLPGGNRDVPSLTEKFKNGSPPHRPEPGALKVLILDLTLLFSHIRDTFSDLVEPPLGPMYLISYLYHRYANNVIGKIVQARIDFDSFGELKEILDTFKPDVIGIRALSINRNFFQQVVAMIRQWGYQVPLIAGGPYATVEYEAILRGANVDVVVLGEGEITFSELVGEIINNNKKLPEEESLKKIKGIAFITGKPVIKEKVRIRLS